MLLEVDNIKKRYKRVQAVDGVSFHIDKGEVFGLLGENGAGKTTIIKILSTLTRPDSGTARIDGADIFSDTQYARRRVAIVTQESNLDRELTVQDSMYIYAKLYGIGNAAKKVVKTAEDFGIADKLKTPVGALSGGQKRRVMLARVMLGDPQLIFMDEPTLGLDPSIRQDIWQMIRDIRDAGKSVLLTTHYTDEAENLCSRVALMKKGKLVKTGTPDALIKQTGAIAADIIMGRMHMVKLFESGSDLDSFIAGNAVTSYNVRTPRLEDVILEMEGKC